MRRLVRHSLPPRDLELTIAGDVGAVVALCTTARRTLRRKSKLWKVNAQHFVKIVGFFGSLVPPKFLSDPPLPAFPL